MLTLDFIKLYTTTTAYLSPQITFYVGNVADSEVIWISNLDYVPSMVILQTFWPWFLNKVPHLLPLDALTTAAVHAFWFSPKFMNGSCCTIVWKTSAPCFITVFLPLNLPMIGLNTALSKQPSSLAGTFCGLPTLERVLVMACWPFCWSYVILQNCYFAL